MTPPEPVPRHAAPNRRRQPTRRRHGTVAAPAPMCLVTVKAIIAEQTGYTTDMLEDELDLEADLGIDTVKQVEIFGKSPRTSDSKSPEDLKLRDSQHHRQTEPTTSAANPRGDATAHPLGQRPARLPSRPRCLATSRPSSPSRPATPPTCSKTSSTWKPTWASTPSNRWKSSAKSPRTSDCEVPEDLKLRDLNTIVKLADYLGSGRSPRDGPSRTTRRGSPARQPRRPRCPGHGQNHHRRADSTLR